METDIIVPMITTIGIIITETTIVIDTTDMPIVSTERIDVGLTDLLIGWRTEKDVPGKMAT